MVVSIVYYLTLLVFTILSWGFVDANAPLPRIAALHPIIYFKTIYPTIWYTGSVGVFFIWYLWMLRNIRKALVSSKEVWFLIAGTTAILIWSYPSLSNDIFNYIATAKVTFFYKENPYIIMPIDIPNEPMLSFLHAANKVALYGPVWIILTAIPYWVGLGNLLLTLFTFKVFIAAWYLLLCYLIWIVSGKKPWALAFFALNPLVTLSTLADGHNDVVMMVLALASFMALKRRQHAIGTMLLIASILIKGATAFLLPIFLWCFYSDWKKKTIPWSRTWYAASVAMYIIFFLSPIREEIYAWYFIWPLVFLALIEKQTLLHAASYGFSFGLMLRIVPFLYTRSWSGITPIVKKIVTFVPPLVSILFFRACHPGQRAGIQLKKKTGFPLSRE